MANLKDDSPMPFGKYEGTAMQDIPDAYLKWFWRENKVKYRSKQAGPNVTAVMDYIKDSFNEKDLV
jgi:uncharacterized protein (DUF3820 family)